MGPEPKNIPPAEIIRNTIRYEGVAHDYTVMPKKHIIEKVKNGFLLTVFCLVSMIFSVIVYPLVIVIFVLMTVPRIVITLYAKVAHYRQKMQILIGEMSFWAAGQDTHIFVQVIQGECDIEMVQQYFISILTEESFLKKVFFRKYGYFCSSVVENIDIHEHIKYYNTENPKFPIKEEEIMFGLENIFSKDDFNKDSDNQRPDWEVLFIPNILPTSPKCDDPNHFALVFRIRNTCLSLSDAVAYLYRRIDDQSILEASDDLPATDRSTNNISRWRKMAIGLTAIFLGPMFLLRSAMLSSSKIHVAKIPPDTDSTIKENGKVCYLSKTDLYNTEALNILKDGTKTSFIAILLSAIGTSCRHLLLGLNYDCPDNLSCSYRISKFCKSHSSGTDGGKITKFHLGIGLDRPMKRLHSALEKTDSKNNMLVAAEELTNRYILKTIGWFPANTVTQIYKRLQNCNVNIEHLVGPTQPFTILRGDVVDIYGWSCQTEQDIMPQLAELRTFLISYCGNVRVCYSGSSKNFSSSHMKALQFEFKSEILKISELCGLERKTLHQ